MSGATGTARGALSGYYPEPGMGHALLCGPAFFDDFRWNTVVQPWVQNTITSAPTWTPQVETGAIGVRQIQTSANAGTGGILRMGPSAFDLPDAPDIGQSYAARIRLTSAQANTTLWTGFTSSFSLAPITGNAVRFVGIRAVDGALEGVCKTGSGAGSETVVSLGIDLSEWRNVGFDVLDTDGAGTAGVQFWYADSSDRRALRITRISDPVVTHIPTGGGGMYLGALGLLTNTGAARTAQIDLVSHVGRAAR